MQGPEILLTVLMPAYNGEKYIGEAIESILRQTYNDFEFIIVNDGSTDRTEEVIRSYKDPRIVLINQQNGGVSAALNTGLKAARGKYIARFDADDVCYDFRLTQQIEFMESHPDYVLAGSDADYMSENGEYLFTYRNIGHSNEEINDRISLYCPFVHSTVIYKKSDVLACGGYEVNAHTFEDYFLWTRLIKRGKVINFKDPMIKVRFNSSSVTVDEKDRDPEFRRLKKKALQTGEISKEEGEIILKSIRKLSPGKKEASYHRMLGKKYLWNNYQPLKARSHLLKAIKTEPLNRAAYLLLAISFLPRKVIMKLYEKNKG
jgi:glycosyltransferase involved in cell wall biosynthesis